MKSKLLALLLSTNALAIEHRTKIGIIDTGLEISKEIKPYICEDGLKDFTNTGTHDYIGHGTNIAGLITKDLPSDKYCIVVIKFAVDYSFATMQAYTQALAFAAKIKVKFLNLSLSGATPNQLEKSILIKMGLANTIISVAAGNDSLDLSKECKAFPACYGLEVKNMYVVSAKDVTQANIKGPVNSYQKGLNVCASGICLTGTSQATAVFLNKLILLGSKLSGGNKDESTKDANR